MKRQFIGHAQRGGQASKVSLQDFLKLRHPAWNLVGRVHFNLAVASQTSVPFC
jgi:hypothetical protein